jgi:hypothetical protein
VFRDVFMLFRYCFYFVSYPEFSSVRLKEGRGMESRDASTLALTLGRNRNENFQN